MARRSARDLMLYHADRAKADLDQSLHHLRVMQEAYENRGLPQGEMVAGISRGVIKIQEAIDLFKANHS